MALVFAAGAVYYLKLLLLIRRSGSSAKSIVCSAGTALALFLIFSQNFSYKTC